MGEVVDWASYDDALDGKLVFTCLLHVWDESKTIEASLASRATQTAVVVGCEYLWVKDAVS